MQPLDNRTVKIAAEVIGAIGRQRASNPPGTFKEALVGNPDLLYSR
jgi:hypothetical protein